MVRQCHSNTCPVGVCSQDEKLRQKFTGTPEKVINLFTFIAEEVREILASLGFKSLSEITGRSDLLYQVSRGSIDLDELDLNEISKPFKSRFGWHVVQVLERRNYDNTESVKRARARSVIGDRKNNEALQNWNRQLLDEAYVEYRLDDI